MAELLYPAISLLYSTLILLLLQLWSFLDYIRTRFESRDPDLLRVIEKVKAVKAMVEAEARKVGHRPLELGGPESHAGDLR